MDINKIRDFALHVIVPKRPRSPLRPADKPPRPNYPKPPG